jgi:hypothetical protein
MKKKLTTLLAILMTGTIVLTSSANNTPSPKLNPTTIYSKVKTVQLPEQLKKEGFDKKVKVLFTVDQSGKVQDVLCISEQAELKSSVEKQFMNLNFPEMNENTLYSICINFKVL